MLDSHCECVIPNYGLVCVLADRNSLILAPESDTMQSLGDLVIDLCHFYDTFSSTKASYRMQKYREW